MLIPKDETDLTLHIFNAQSWKPHEQGEVSQSDEHGGKDGWKKKGVHATKYVSDCIFFRFQDISWNFRGGFHHHIGHHHINTQLAASQMVRTQHSVMDTLTKQFHCDLQSRPCTITAVQFTVMMCCDVLLWWWLSSHLYSLHFAAPSSFWKSGKRSLGFKTSFDK